ncbi:hypothetical protein [Streptomyces venezuelae]|uniref:hypothetical protein n=1 Tax=Streptomyces venezuelae TaxID=54571 RepID=UPI0037D538B3
MPSPGGAAGTTTTVTVPDHAGATAAVYEVTRTPEGPEATATGAERPYTVRVLGSGAGAAARVLGPDAG